MDAKRVRATQSFGELPAEAAEQRKLIWRRLCGAMIEGTEHPFHWRIGE